jgi:hypothetical protein
MVLTAGPQALLTLVGLFLRKGDRPSFQVGGW